MRFRAKKLGFRLAADLFFWRSPKSGEKNSLNFGEDLFLGEGLPIFRHKNRLNPIEHRSKSGSRSFNVVSNPQNSPPLHIPGYAPAVGSALLKSNREPTLNLGTRIEVRNQTGNQHKQLNILLHHHW